MSGRSSTSGYLEALEAAGYLDDDSYSWMPMLLIFGGIIGIVILIIVLTNKEKYEKRIMEA